MFVCMCAYDKHACVIRPVAHKSFQIHSSIFAKWIADIMKRGVWNTGKSTDDEVLNICEMELWSHRKKKKTITKHFWVTT